MFDGNRAKGVTAVAAEKKEKENTEGTGIQCCCTVIKITDLPPHRHQRWIHSYIKKVRLIPKDLGHVNFTRRHRPWKTNSDEHKFAFLVMSLARGVRKSGTTQR